MTEMQAEAIMKTFYKHEVEKYGKKFEVTKSLAENLKKVASFLVDSSRTKWGIFITGKIGNGKTTLVNAITNMVNFLISEDYLERKTDYSNCFKVVPAKEVVRLFVEERNEYYAIRDRENLLIDDIGEDAFEVVIYGVPYHPIRDLLMSRYANRRFTVLTSNLTSGEFKDKYHDERLSDRLREMFLGISFNDKSFR